MQKRPNKYPDSSPAAVDSQTLLINSTLLYLMLGGIGFLICYYKHDSLSSIFAWPASWTERGYLVSLGVLGAGVLIILSYVFEEYFITYKSLRHLFMRFMGRLPIWVTLYLALISSIAEEILFRGAIQPALGLSLTSLLFGLMHLGPTRSIGSWSLWAAIAGLLMGWTFEETQSIWPPLITHLLVNSFSMLRFRVEYSRLLKQSQQQDSKSITGGQ